MTQCAVAITLADRFVAERGTERPLICLGNARTDGANFSLSDGDECRERAKYISSLDLSL